MHLNQHILLAFLLICWCEYSHSACSSCPAFAYSPEASKSIQQCACLAGYTGFNGTNCSACALGTYKDVMGPANCTACPENSVSARNATSADECLCLPGFYRHESAACVACPAGTFKDHAGNGNCSACPENAASPVQSTSVANCTCMSGFERTDSDTCTACAANFYSDAFSAQACEACPAHSHSAAQSASSASCLCQSGHFLVHPVVHHTEGASASAHAPVKLHTAQTDGMTVVARLAYAAGDINDYTSALNVPAPQRILTIGSNASDAALFQLNLFYLKMFESGGSVLVYASLAQCGDLSATIATYQVDDTNFTVTYRVHWEYEPSPGHAKATIAVHVGDAVISQQSVACNNSTRLTDGVYDDVYVGWTADAMYGPTLTPMSDVQIYDLALSDADLAHARAELHDPEHVAPPICMACLQGTYAPDENMGACLACDPNAQSETGSVNATACRCKSGFTGPDGGTCVACEAGKYKEPPAGDAPCVDCPAHTQSPVNSSFRDDCVCIPGYTGADGEECTACVAGTFKDTPGSAACSNCTANAGSAPGSTGHGNCSCNAGYHGVGAEDSNFTCAACAAGLYKNASGQQACSACAVDYYSDHEAAAYCLSCPVSNNSTMTTNGLTGQSTCVCTHNHWWGPEVADIREASMVVGGVYGHSASYGNKEEYDAMPYAFFRVNPENEIYWNPTSLRKCTADNGLPGYKVDGVCMDKFDVLDDWARAAYSKPSGWTPRLCPLNCYSGEFSYELGRDIDEPCYWHMKMKQESLDTCLQFTEHGRDAYEDWSSEYSSGSWRLLFPIQETLYVPDETRQPDEQPYTTTIHATLDGNYQPADTQRLFSVNNQEHPNMEFGIVLGYSLRYENVQEWIHVTNGHTDSMYKWVKITPKTPTGVFARYPEVCNHCPAAASSVVNSSAATDCKCNAGYTGADGAACSSCAAGTYKPDLGSAACTNCSAHTYSTALAATSDATCQDCDVCGIGLAEETACVKEANITCAACIPGQTFANVTGMHECRNCTVCKAGDFARVNCTATTDTVCGVCPAGTYTAAAGGTCIECPKNTYNPTPGGESIEACLPCMEFSETETIGHERQEACMCLSGYWHVNRSFCEACTPGTYNPLRNQSQCSNCPAGTHSPDVNATSVGSCEACPVGTYSREGQRLCTPCNINASTVSNGSVSVEQCLCDPGFTLLFGHCVECLAGTYKDFLGNESCTACGNDTYSAAIGATNASTCATCGVCGKGEEEDATCTQTTNTSCAACAAGVTFKDFVGPDECETCGVCGVGQEQAQACTVASNETCRPCPAFTFKNVTGPDACQNCSVCGVAQGLNASCSAGVDTVCQGCVDGQTFKDEPGNVACAACHVCPAGHTRDTACTPSADETCVACATGTFKAAPGPDACSACYTCGTGEEQTAACTNVSNTTCAGCDEGFYKDSVGSEQNCTACTVCPAGFQQDATCTRKNNTQCSPCQANSTHKAHEGAGVCEACHVCPAGEAETTACTVVANTTCTPCEPLVSFKSDAGAGQCIDCAACGVGVETDKECTVTSNRTCKACVHGETFKSSDATNVSCAQCAVCGSGETRASECTPAADEVCVACISGSTFKVSSGPQPCDNCSACPPGITVSVACRADSDTVCADSTDEYEVVVTLAVRQQTQSIFMNWLQAFLGRAVQFSPVFRRRLLEAAPELANIRFDDLTATDLAVLVAQLDTACDAYNSDAATTVEDQIDCSLFSYKIVKNPNPCVAGLTWQEADDGDNCTACSECVAGSYTKTACVPNQDTECVPCAAGTHSSNPNITSQAECVQCPANFYTDGSGATSCTACGPLRSSAPGTGNSSGCECVAGHEPSGSGSSCTACAVGKFKGTAGNFACEPCSTGSFAGDTGSTECTLCALNTYAAQPGKSACLGCPSFTQTLSEGTTNISGCLCQKGYLFDATYGDGLCTKCGYGKFKDEVSNAETCAPCAPGTYQDGSTPDACQPFTACEPRRVEIYSGSATTNKLCAVCPPGFRKLLPQHYNFTASTLDPLDAACEQCEQCGAGYEDESTCSRIIENGNSLVSSRRTGVGGCRECSSGLFSPGRLSWNDLDYIDTSDNPETATHAALTCQPCSECAAGHGQVLPCTIVGNAVCEPCTPTETFKVLPGPQTCQNCTDCLDAEVVYECTADTDRVCGDSPHSYTAEVSVEATTEAAFCAFAQWMAGILQVPLSALGAGQCDSGARRLLSLFSGALQIGGLSPAQLGLFHAALQGTLPPSYTPSPGNVTLGVLQVTQKDNPCTLGATFETARGSGNCTACHQCSAGEYASTLCALLSDAQCSPCTAGVNFSSAAGAETCTACSVCAAGTYETSACNRTHDTGCAPCSAGSNFSAHMGASTCTPCSTCGMGFFEAEACTPANNTVCETCSSCADDEVVDVPCSFSSDVKCKPSPFGGPPKNAEEAADRAFFQGLLSHPGLVTVYDPSLMTVWDTLAYLKRRGVVVNASVLDSNGDNYVSPQEYSVVMALLLNLTAIPASKIPGTVPRAEMYAALDTDNNHLLSASEVAQHLSFLNVTSPLSLSAFDARLDDVHAFIQPVVNALTQQNMSALVVALGLDLDPSSLPNDMTAHLAAALRSQGIGVNFMHADSDSDGEVASDEFLVWMQQMQTAIAPTWADLADTIPASLAGVALDVDDDGVVSASELALVYQAGEGLIALNPSVMDADQNNSTSTNETSTFFSGLQLLTQTAYDVTLPLVAAEKARPLLSRSDLIKHLRARGLTLGDIVVDLDGDGLISQAEYEAFLLQLAHLTREALPESTAGAFAIIDTNGDGEMSQAEFEAFVSANNLPSNFSAVDGNGDGMLTVYEISQHTVAVQQLSGMTFERALADMGVQQSRTILPPEALAEIAGAAGVVGIPMPTHPDDGEIDTVEFAQTVSALRNYLFFDPTAAAAVPSTELLFQAIDENGDGLFSTTEIQQFSNSSTLAHNIYVVDPQGAPIVGRDELELQAERVHNLTTLTFPALLEAIGAVPNTPAPIATLRAHMTAQNLLCEEAVVDINQDGVVTEAEFRAFTRQVHTFSTPTFTAPETPQVPTIASFFLAVDTDGSGAVSRAELELFSHSMPIQSNFSAVDTDGSNSVSQAELLAHLNALASVVTSTHSSMLAGSGRSVNETVIPAAVLTEYVRARGLTLVAESFDNNQNLLVDKAEFSALKQQLQPFAGAPRVQNSLRVVHSADGDGNGTVSAAEMDSFLQGLPFAVNHSEFDVDGDGGLSAREVYAMFGDVQQATSQNYTAATAAFAAGGNASVVNASKYVAHLREHGILVQAVDSNATLNQTEFAALRRAIRSMQTIVPGLGPVHVISTYSSCDLVLDAEQSCQIGTGADAINMLFKKGAWPNGTTERAQGTIFTTPAKLQEELGVGNVMVYLTPSGTVFEAPVEITMSTGGLRKRAGFTVRAFKYGQNAEGASVLTPAAGYPYPVGYQYPGEDETVVRGVLTSFSPQVAAEVKSDKEDEVPESESSSNNMMVIIGGAVGGIIVIAAAVFFLWKRKSTSASVTSGSNVDNGNLFFYNVAPTMYTTYEPVANSVV